jgi:hypothetical protein
MHLPGCGEAMIAFIIALACLLTAEAGAAETYQLRVGFDGIYRTGSWTPLTLEFPAASKDIPQAVRVWVEDPDGQYVRSPAAPVEPGADGRPVARLTVRFGRPTARVLVELVSAAADAAGTGPPAVAVPAILDQAVATRQSLPAPIPATETVMLVLGDLPAAERASRLLSRDDGTRPRVVAIKNAATGGGAGGAAALGRTARDFDGADSIIVCGRSVADFDPAVLRGIDAWARQGGQLVFVAGSSAIDIAHSGTPAATWLPGPVAKLVPLRRGNAIETYARASRPLDKGAIAGLELPLFEDPQAIEGSVEAFEGRGPTDLPLVVRRAHGLGTLVWAGVDIDQLPFRDWSGSDTLLVEMLRGRRAVQDAGRAGETARGTLDLAGQLRQAIDRFPGVAPIPFEVIAGLGILYVACLYPLDWWLVAGWRRGNQAGGLRTSWLAWLSLPLIVTALSGLSWAAGQHFKGTRWQTSAAGLVDLDMGSGLMRVASFAGIWSPLNARLDLEVRPDKTILPATSADADRPLESEVSWFAARGRGIGGTDAASPHPSLAATDYGYHGSAAAIDGIPIAASSSRLFEAEITGFATTPAVESTLAREGQGTLRGAVSSRLSFPLEDCVLAHAGWLYDVGTLRPGQSFEPGAGRGPRSLAGALTRRTVQKDREVSMRWDVTEQDPVRILEIAGFHAAAGGSGYTSLESGRLARFDLSPLLPLDRAVLVGRGPAFVDWECRPQSLASTNTSAQVPPMPGQTCLWRIVIPLVRTMDANPGSTSPSNPAPSPNATLP